MGGTKKDNQFSYQVNEDLLNPWFYTQGMIGIVKLSKT